MSIWIDHKYAGLLSPRLTRFKQKSKDTYNFRCPICLDSKISEKKARGWLFTTANALRFFCHNCGASLSFRDFLKEVDVNLFDEYQKEKFMEDNFVQAKSKELDVDKFKTYIPKILRNKSPLRDLKKVSQLPVEHKFKKYITSRKIPPNHHFRLFYCPKFKEWVNSFIPNKFNNVEKDSSRLIIPFIDSDGKFFGCQGRSLRNGDIRYITIMLDESIPKIFGFANGGTPPINRPSLVGERGPELFVPKTSGTIIPNEKINSGSTNINFTINTVDAQGVDELLTNRRSTIINVINDALNRQGKEALV